MGGRFYLHFVECKADLASPGCGDGPLAGAGVWVEGWVVRGGDYPALSVVVAAANCSKPGAIFKLILK